MRPGEKPQLRGSQGAVGRASASRQRVCNQGGGRAHVIPDFWGLIIAAETQGSGSSWTPASKGLGAQRLPPDLGLGCSSGSEGGTTSESGANLPLVSALAVVRRPGVALGRSGRFYGNECAPLLVHHFKERGGFSAFP